MPTLPLIYRQIDRIESNRAILKSFSVTEFTDQKCEGTPCSRKRTIELSLELCLLKVSLFYSRSCCIEKNDEAEVQFLMI